MATTFLMTHPSRPLRQGPIECSRPPADSSRRKAASERLLQGRSGVPFDDSLCGPRHAGLSRPSLNTYCDDYEQITTASLLFPSIPVKSEHYNCNASRNTTLTRMCFRLQT